MSAPDTTPAGKAPDLTSATSFITAVAAAVGAWKLFEPKFGRIRAIREEIGNLEVSFRVLYQFPQWLLAVLSILIFLFLIMAFFDSFSPIGFAHYPPLRWIREIVQPTNIVLIILLMSVLGAFIYWNILTHFLLLLSSLLALLPLPGLRNRFGRHGESIGWHQAAATCEGPDKGSPLLVDHAAIDRVSWQVLAKLGSQSDRPPNYAAEPEGRSASEKANIALFGCIMEQNTYANRWPLPAWAAFYDCFAEIQRADPIFTPKQLGSFNSGDAFFANFRQSLDAALRARNQPSPPDQSLAAAADVIGAWSLLKAKYWSDVLNIIPA